MKKRVTLKKCFRKLAGLMAYVMLLSLLGMFPSYGPVSVQGAETKTFVHPGLLHTAESFSAMKSNVEKGVQPNLDTWNELINNGFSAANWQPRPLEHVIRGIDGDNRGQLCVDIRRAYQTALIWKINGSEEHGEAACRILNAWSSTMKTLDGNADRFLAAGLYGGQLAMVSEIVRDHPSFDKKAMDDLLLDIFYPMTHSFLTNHNDAYIGNYWANWDLCNIGGMMAIGIFTDRADIYNEALTYFKVGLGNGSFYNTMPYVYEDGTAQWQESGRDQGHTTLGISLCGTICEMAWNQGDDLYSLSDNRFLKAAEYVARYNSGEEVQYSPYLWLKTFNGGDWQNEISEGARGHMRPVYSLVYNHYVNRMGLSAPNLKKLLFPTENSYLIEGPQSNGDELGWQTLTYANTGTRTAVQKIQGDFKDGKYRIRSVLTGKSIVVNAEGNLASAQEGTRTDEWWYFKNKGDGEYIVTNTVTGQVMQCNEKYYEQGSLMGTGKADGGLNQNFAFIKNDTGDYRIIPTAGVFVLDLKGVGTTDDTPIIQYRNRSTDGQKWIIESAKDILGEDETPEVLAHFDFDDAQTGFVSEYGKAEGTYILQKHDDGNALYLNGSTDFLTVTAKDGTSLLTGVEELTISFQAKPESSATNWGFYAAPNADTQKYPQEKYLGILDKNGELIAERFNNSGSRPVSAAAMTNTSDWYYVTVVHTAAETILYINGEEVSRQSSAYSLTELLGKNSILYIGKANWGNGEYYKGLIDNYTIIGRALSAEEVKTEADKYATGQPEPILTPMPTPTPTPEPGLPYVDVEKQDWFYDAVYFNYKAGTMTGMDPTHFAPYGYLSRAQFALILYRIEGEPKIDMASPFGDIEGSEWYGKAVLWAYKNKIVSGYENKMFGPADMITREQMAVMMHRYGDYLKMDTSASGDFQSFKDAEKVSSFAKDAMNWAVSKGVITGKENGTLLDPQGNTARAEAAAIIWRFMDL